MKKRSLRIITLVFVFTLLLSVAVFAAPRVTNTGNGTWQVAYDNGSTVSYTASSVVVSGNNVVVTYQNGTTATYNNMGALVNSGGGTGGGNADTLFDWQKATGGNDITNIKNQFGILGKNIHELIQSILIIVGFIVLLVYFAKHWFVGNDAQKKRELKDEGASYFKGAVGFFAASFIYKLIYLFATSFNL